MRYEIMLLFLYLHEFDNKRDHRCRSAKGVIFKHPMMRRRVKSAFTCLIILLGPSSASAWAATGSVVCTATKALTCEAASGCRDDRALYTSSFQIDLDKRQATLVSYQLNPESDSKWRKVLGGSPKPDGTTLSVTGVGKDREWFGTLSDKAENVVTLAGQVGLSAFVTILVGEKSYIETRISSASVGGAAPSVYIQLGSCKGLEELVRGGPFEE